MADGLAAFKVPTYVELWHDKLPRNASGKLLKNVLRGRGRGQLRRDDVDVGRRALLVGLALLLGGACTEPSRIDRDAKVTVEGTVEDVDGAPLASRPVRLGSGVSGLEGSAGALTLGLFCITGECTGDFFDAETDADGRYSFELTGADTQSAFGEAVSFLLSTSGEPRDDQTTGPVVSARFRIQTEALTLPTLRLVDPRLRLTAEARTVVARWEASAPGPYALGFTGPGRALVWEASAADPAATVDARVLEDVTGLATVAGVRTDQATGSDVTTHWRSPGLAYRGGFGAPPSRGAACEARAADGLAQALDGCPLTDGSFDVAGVLGSVCAGPATSAGSSTQPPACAPVERVRVHLPRPVAAELLVVRGCSEPCRADTVVADGGTAIDVGPVSGPFATVALGGTRVTAVDIVTTDPTSLAEVSVWGPVAEGPALRPVADPEALAPTTGDDEEDRRVPAALATVALLGALVLLYRLRPALAGDAG